MFNWVLQHPRVSGLLRNPDFSWEEWGGREREGEGEGEGERDREGGRGDGERETERKGEEKGGRERERGSFLPCEIFRVDSVNTWLCPTKCRLFLIS